MEVTCICPIEELFSRIDSLSVFVGAAGSSLAAVRDTLYRFVLIGHHRFWRW